MQFRVRAEQSPGLGNTAGFVSSDFDACRVAVGHRWMSFARADSDVIAERLVGPGRSPPDGSTRPWALQSDRLRPADDVYRRRWLDGVHHR
jgi:hypothetical protein